MKKSLYISGKLGIFDKQHIIEDFEDLFNKVIKNILNFLIWRMLFLFFKTSLEKGKKISDSK